MRTIVSCIALMALVSCTATSPEEEPSLHYDGPVPAHLSSVMSVEALMYHSPDGRAVVDLWSPEIGYWVEPGLEHTDIDVICPSGRVMNLEEWRQEFKVSPGLWEDGVIMFSSGNRSYGEVEKYEPRCTDPCSLEEEDDATWTCLGPAECGG